ncbi:hypothetical protein CBR_g42040 [Chara braunii]|uniref:Uncharacterized protein n=1 Tax=Chara braunii TaxID=69332 RepID=A0A388LWS2_CHABU|nr:hypothetical protein CBR_g42040 [Chara braunii]|eukprot:GBG86756.1 hypothetical protein CBR_g42040 [Chara braunii]
MAFPLAGSPSVGPAKPQRSSSSGNSSLTSLEAAPAIGGSRSSKPQRASGFALDVLLEGESSGAPGLSNIASHSGSSGFFAESSKARWPSSETNDGQPMGPLGLPSGSKEGTLEYEYESSRSMSMAVKKIPSRRGGRRTSSDGKSMERRKAFPEEDSSRGDFRGHDDEDSNQNRDRILGSAAPSPAAVPGTESGERGGGEPNFGSAANRTGAEASTVAPTARGERDSLEIAQETSSIMSVRADEKGKDPILGGGGPGGEDAMVASKSWGKDTRRGSTRDARLSEVQQKGLSRGGRILTSDTSPVGFGMVGGAGDTANLLRPPEFDSLDWGLMGVGNLGLRPGNPKSRRQSLKSTTKPPEDRDQQTSGYGGRADADSGKMEAAVLRGNTGGQLSIAGSVRPGSDKGTTHGVYPTASDTWQDGAGASTSIAENKSSLSTWGNPSTSTLTTLSEMPWDGTRRSSDLSLPWPRFSTTGTRHKDPLESGEPSSPYGDPEDGDVAQRGRSSSDTIHISQSTFLDSTQREGLPAIGRQGAKLEEDTYWKKGTETVTGESMSAFTAATSADASDLGSTSMIGASRNAEERSKELNSQLGRTTNGRRRSSLSWKAEAGGEGGETLARKQEDEWGENFDVLTMLPDGAQPAIADTQVNRGGSVDGSTTITSSMMGRESNMLGTKGVEKGPLETEAAGQEGEEREDERVGVSISSPLQSPEFGAYKPSFLSSAAQRRPPMSGRRAVAGGVELGRRRSSSDPDAILPTKKGAEGNRDQEGGKQQESTAHVRESPHESGGMPETARRTPRMTSTIRMTTVASGVFRTRPPLRTRQRTEGKTGRDLDALLFDGESMSRSSSPVSHQTETPSPRMASGVSVGESRSPESSGVPKANDLREIEEGTFPILHNDQVGGGPPASQRRISRLLVDDFSNDMGRRKSKEEQGGMVSIDVGRRLSSSSSPFENLGKNEEAKPPEGKEEEARAVAEMEKHRKEMAEMRDRLQDEIARLEHELARTKLKMEAQVQEKEEMHKQQERKCAMDAEIHEREMRDLREELERVRLAHTKEVQNSEDAARGHSSLVKELQAIREQKEKLEVENRAYRAEMETDRRQIEEMTIERGRLEGEVGGMRLQLERLRKEAAMASDMAQKAQTERIEGMQRQFEMYEGQIAEQRANYESQIKMLQEKQGSTIAGMERRHSEETKALKDTHDALVASLQTGHAQELEAKDRMLAEERECLAKYKAYMGGFAEVMKKIEEGTLVLQNMGKQAAAEREAAMREHGEWFLGLQQLLAEREASLKSQEEEVHTTRQQLEALRLSLNQVAQELHEMHEEEADRLQAEHERLQSLQESLQKEREMALNDLATARHDLEEIVEAKRREKEALTNEIIEERKKMAADRMEALELKEEAMVAKAWIEGVTREHRAEMKNEKDALEGEKYQLSLEREGNLELSKTLEEERARLLAQRKAMAAETSRIQVMAAEVEQQAEASKHLREQGVLAWKRAQALHEDALQKAKVSERNRRDIERARRELTDMKKEQDKERLVIATERKRLSEERREVDRERTDVETWKANESVNDPPGFAIRRSRGALLAKNESCRWLDSTSSESTSSITASRGLSKLEGTSYRKRRNKRKRRCRGAEKEKPTKDLLKTLLVEIRRLNPEVSRCPRVWTNGCYSSPTMAWGGGNHGHRGCPTPRPPIGISRGYLKTQAEFLDKARTMAEMFSQAASSSPYSPTNGIAMLSLAQAAQVLRDHKRDVTETTTGHSGRGQTVAHTCPMSGGGDEERQGPQPSGRDKMISISCPNFWSQGNTSGLSLIQPTHNGPSFPHAGTLGIGLGALSTPMGLSFS